MILAALETSSLPFRPCDDIIDYPGTRSSDGTCSLSFLSMRQLLSTTSVLDLRMGHAPFLVHKTSIIDYSGTRSSDGTSSLYFSTMRRQLIDYCSTRFSDGTSSLFSSTMRRLTRLLQYSISGWDQLPIFSLTMRRLVRLLWYSNLGCDQFPIFFSTMRRLTRLLRYSVSGWDQLPIFSINVTSTYSTTAVLDLRTGHAPYLARGISSYMRRQPIDYHRDPRTGPDPYIQRTYSSHLQDDELSDYSSTRPTDRTCSLSRKRISTSMRQQLVDYSENIRLLRYSKKQIKTANDKGNQPIGRQLKRKYYTSE
jgi:hypothetical protein